MHVDEVSTSRYEFSHGRSPRGQGSWGFFLGSSSLEDLFWANGTYSEARRAAVAEANRRGVSSVEVAP